jgi:hypothetical protein
MDAVMKLETTRKQLIQKLLEKRKEIDRQLDQLGHKKEPDN